MKLRSLSIGLGLLAGGTVIGTATPQFAAADGSNGDRRVAVADNVDTIHRNPN